MAIRDVVSLGEMAEGFPFAFKVYILAGLVFISFNFGSVLASNTLAYRDWLEVAQPLTDAVAEYIPAVPSATTYMEKNRARLEQSEDLYWIPAVRNVLSFDFGLIFVFSVCFTMAILIDLLWDSERAYENIAKVSNKYGHSPGAFVLGFTMYLLLCFVPFYFSVFGVADPHLTSLTTTMMGYFVIIGAGGLAIVGVIYFAIPCVIGRLCAIGSIRKLHIS
jgi:hypothetical protein